MTLRLDKVIGVIGDRVKVQSEDGSTHDLDLFVGANEGTLIALEKSDPQHPDFDRPLRSDSGDEEDIVEDGEEGEMRGD
jgi:hypothetical protein